MQKIITERLERQLIKLRWGQFSVDCSLLTAVWDRVLYSTLLLFLLISCILLPFHITQDHFVVLWSCHISSSYDLFLACFKMHLRWVKNVAFKQRLGGQFFPTSLFLVGLDWDLFGPYPSYVVVLELGLLCLDSGLVALVYRPHSQT